jgi:hypothetical protein
VKFKTVHRTLISCLWPEQFFPWFWKRFWFLHKWLWAAGKCNMSLSLIGCQNHIFPSRMVKFVCNIPIHRGMKHNWSRGFNTEGVGRGCITTPVMFYCSDCIFASMDIFVRGYIWYMYLRENIDIFVHKKNVTHN